MSSATISFLSATDTHLQSRPTRPTATWWRRAETYVVIEGWTVGSFFFLTAAASPCLRSNIFRPPIFRPPAAMGLGFASVVAARHLPRDPASRRCCNLGHATVEAAQEIRPSRCLGRRRVAAGKFPCHTVSGLSLCCALDLFFPHCRIRFVYVVIFPLALVLAQV